MHDFYLLYIDILGFADLVERAPGRVDDLYQIIESLNVRAHGAFATITFSDTVLIHNIWQPTTNDDHEYIVMYQCEFVQDLLHRLAGRNIYFRAVLTYGPFEHYRLNGTPYYYGPALNHAFREEKQLKITGLLMDDHCDKHNRFFSSLPFKKGWHYVFVTQALDEFEDLYGGIIPLPSFDMHATDLAWYLGPELEVLHSSLLIARGHGDEQIRQKHEATLAQYRIRYPKCFDALEKKDFMMEEVCREFDWTQIRARMKDDYKWASAKRPPLPGSSRRSVTP
ncbi:MAG: hypothetical protein WBO19_01955 [Terriglobia bacterium]|jgi:hypothetical protein